MDTLILQYSVTPLSKVELTPEFRPCVGRWEIWSTCPDLCDYHTLIDQSSELLTTLSDACMVMGNCESEHDFAVARGHLETIRSQATRLRAALLPNEVIQRLQATPSIRQIIFRCDPLLNGVLFDHMFLWDDFLCFSYATGKQLLARRLFRADRVGQAGQLPYQGYSVVDPGGQLPDAVGEEFNGFRSAWREDRAGRLADKIDFDRAMIGQQVTTEQLADLIRNNEFVNAIMHHRYDEKSPEESRYILSETPEVVFAARNLLDCLGPGDRPPLVFFSSACESAITRGWETNWPREEHLYGMVDAAQRAGIRHYVSTLIKIPASQAVRPLLPFYRAIAAGETVGEALRQARRAFRRNPEDPLDGGTVLGLAFVLYGDSGTPYLCAEGHRTHNKPTVSCLGVKNDGSVCGRTICPKEARFSERRCEIHRTDTKIGCSAGHEVESVEERSVCSRTDCIRTYCTACVGNAKGLCWFHCCHKGHAIIADARKTCPDRQRHHPNEKRTVCPLDDGWMRGLCDECLSEETAAQSCPHCRRFITKDNPWFGLCADCERQLCAKCGPFYERTMYCPDLTRTQADRDSGWLGALSERAGQDGQLATQARLRSILGVANEFQANVDTNLKTQVRRLTPMPRLSPSLGEVFGPRARIMGIKDVAVCSEGDNPLLVRLQELWSNLPADPQNAEKPWCPPRAWMEDLKNVNQVKLYILKSTWGRPVLVAVTSLVPVEFDPMRGPVLVPANARHLDEARKAIEDWWRSDKRGDIPDMYLVAWTAHGWADHTGPIHKPRFLSVLAESQGDTWAVRTPPLDGLPPEVRSFVQILKPETVHKRMEAIRKWIVKHLEAHDFVTAIKVQDELEPSLVICVSDDEVMSVFDDLAESGRYARCEVNEKPAVRPATPSERSKRMLRRRWVEILASIVAAAMSFAVWRMRDVLKKYLPDHPVTWLVTTILCFAFCHLVARALKRTVRCRRRR